MADEREYPRYFRMDGFIAARVLSPGACPETYAGQGTWERRSIVPHVDGTPINDGPELTELLRDFDATH